ncbi:MAG: hypothetical protein ACKVZJ_10610 [Phycisphaerales bacterium]
MEREKLIEWDRFIKAIDAATSGDQTMCNPVRLGASIGWDEPRTKREVKLLRGMEVLRVSELGGGAQMMVALTDLGLRCVEQPWLLARLGDSTIGTGNITVNGPNTRVNIHSVDNSTNTNTIVSSQVFADLRAALTRVDAPAEDIERLRAKVDALEAAAGQPGFLDRYNDFIASAANHMTVISPFLPALGQVLKTAMGS